MKRALSVVAALASLALAGCDRPAPRVTSGDEAPEAFVGQARLRTVFTRDGAWLVSPVLDAPDGATRVAVWLSTFVDAVDASLGLEARGYLDDGSTTAWRALETRWSESPQRVLRADLGVVAVAIEVRVRERDADKLNRLIWSAVVPDPDIAAREATNDARAPGDLDASAPTSSQHHLDIPGVQPRSAWGARAPTGCDSNSTKTWITVHHSVTALDDGGDHAADVRGIQAYHMDGRGYCDIAYHFATTSDGTVWEGREAQYLGAHTGSHNTNNAGIVFVGCFHPTADCDGLGALTPPQAMLNGGGAVIGAIAAHYGIAITDANIIGHRDNPDQSTACPGDNLHDLLPQLRAIAAGGTVVGGTGKVQGVVWDLAVTTDAAQSEATGARRPGAHVQVEGGPATTARAGDSYWSFDLDPGTYTLTATLDGYAPATKQVQIAAGDNAWSSIGISPLPQAVDLTVVVTDSADATPIVNANVAVTGADPQPTTADGSVHLALAAGTLTIDVGAEGYTSQTVTRDVAAGAVERVDIALVKKVVDPGEGEGEGEVNIQPTDKKVQRVTILPPKNAKGGCAGTDPDDAGPLVVFLLSFAMLVASFKARRRA